MHSISTTALPPKQTSPDSNEGTIVAKLLTRRKLKCTNVACGNELEVMINCGIDGHQYTEQHDQLSKRLSNSEKCTKCQSVLDEIAEDRIVESVQFATCSGNQSLTLVALPSELVGKLQAGDKFVIHGYPKCSIDGGFLQRLNPEPRIYIHARSIEIAKAPHQTPSFGTSSIFNDIDDLITSLQISEVMSPLWRQLTLLIIVTYASCLSDKPISLLVVTDDTHVVSRLLSRLPKLRYFNCDSEMARKVISFNSRHIQGGSYTITKSSQFDQDCCLFIENLETLKTSELNSLSATRKCGIIACCPFGSLKKINMISSEFDLVFSLDTLSIQDHIAASSFVFSSRKPANTMKIEPYFSDHSIPLACESLLKEYFVASRTVIGSSNYVAIFPIYDPSRQQSLGIHLARVFQAIRCSESMARDHVFLSFLAQEINLNQRFGSSVFQERPRLEDAMPSPCPSVDARVPVESTYQETGSFQNRYGPIIRDLLVQINLS